MRKFKIILIILPVVIIVAWLVMPYGSRGHMPLKRSVTNQRLKTLVAAVKFFTVEYRLIPQGTTSNIIAVLSARNTDHQNRKRIRFLCLEEVPSRHFPEIDKSGNYLDGWARPISITFEQGHSGTNEVICRSFGTNGVQDQDDIVEIGTLFGK